MTDRVAVLLAAGGEPWEATALRLLGGERPPCSSGASTCTTCSPAPPPDRPTWPWCPASSAASTPTRWCSCCVTTSAASPSAAGGRARPGSAWSSVVPSTDLTLLRRRSARPAPAALVVDPDPPLEVGSQPAAAPGRLIAVHGPAGAPGRTTLAIGLAAEHAHRGSRACSSTPTRTEARSPSTSVSSTRSPACWPRRGWSTRASLDAASFARCRRVVGERLRGADRPAATRPLGRGAPGCARRGARRGGRGR